MKIFYLIFTMLVFFQSAKANKIQEVNEVLDGLHASASRADSDSYFKLFTTDAVFIGTDVSEYWSIEEFKAFANPYFSQGKGWTYVTRNREIKFSQSQKTAWFHEVLDNKSYGTTRGTGVLVHNQDKGWLISQYHLTIPMPNDLAADFAQKIKQFEAKNNDIEKIWTTYIESKGGLTWGESDQYPEYDKVNEGDTIMIQLKQGRCLMEFYHSRWRRANDVIRWDDSINEYMGCPFVFD